MPGFANPDAYELWMGRWSSRMARAFVRFAGLPGNGRFLDVGCGTGALTDALLEAHRDATVVGIDPAEDYVAYCRERFRDGRLSFDRGDATAVPFAADSFDGSLALLILQEVPDAPKAVREMQRVTRPGGFVATSQWNFADGLPMLALFWEAAVETIADDATRESAAQVMRVDYPDESALRQLWEDSGLADVQTRTLDMTMAFANFEDYWTPFMSGVTSSASFAGKLGDEKRRALKECLRRKVLGKEPDRPFTLPAQTWAIRGTVPEV